MSGHIFWTVLQTQKEDDRLGDAATCVLYNIIQHLVGRNILVFVTINSVQSRNSVDEIDQVHHQTVLVQAKCTQEGAIVGSINDILG